MNLVLVCCLCVILHETSSQEYLEYPTEIETFYAEEAENCDASGIVGCSEDCSGVQYCFMNDLINVPCGAGKSCDENKKTCLEGTPNCTVQIKPPFKCPGKGYYPYAIDCHKLWDCTTGSAAHVLSCGKLIFDVLNNKCTASTDADLCHTFTAGDLCSGGTIFAVHPRNKAIYALCNRSFPQIDVCLEGHFFNPELPGCTFECKTLGHFKDPYDPEWYYICEDKKTEHIRCEEGYIFNDQLKICTKKR